MTPHPQRRPKLLVSSSPPSTYLFPPSSLPAPHRPPAPRPGASQRPAPAWSLPVPSTTTSSPPSRPGPARRGRLWAGGAAWRRRAPLAPRRAWARQGLWRPLAKQRPGRPGASGETAVRAAWRGLQTPPERARAGGASRPPACISALRPGPRGLGPHRVSWGPCTPRAQEGCRGRVLRQDPLPSTKDIHRLLFYLHNSPVRSVLLLFPFARCENRGTAGIRTEAPDAAPRLNRGLHRNRLSFVTLGCVTEPQALICLAAQGLLPKVRRIPGHMPAPRGKASGRPRPPPGTPPPPAEPSRAGPAPPAPRGNGEPQGRRDWEGAEGRRAPPGPLWGYRVGAPPEPRAPCPSRIQLSAPRPHGPKWPGQGKPSALPLVPGTPGRPRRGDPTALGLRQRAADVGQAGGPGGRTTPSGTGLPSGQRPSHPTATDNCLGALRLNSSSWGTLPIGLCLSFLICEKGITCIIR